MYYKMKRTLILLIAIPALLASCVSQKNTPPLEADHKETKDLLNSATVRLKHMY